MCRYDDCRLACNVCGGITPTTVTAVQHNEAKSDPSSACCSSIVVVSLSVQHHRREGGQARSLPVGAVERLPAGCGDVGHRCSRRWPHLGILQQWSSSNGCPWNRWICVGAATLLLSVGAVHRRLLGQARALVLPKVTNTLAFASG